MNTMYVALFGCHMGHWETQLSGSYAGGEVERRSCPYPVHWLCVHSCCDDVTRLWETGLELQQCAPKSSITRALHPLWVAQWGRTRLHNMPIETEGEEMKEKEERDSFTLDQLTEFSCTAPQVTKLDDISPLIFLNRTKAALNCAAGSMQVSVAGHLIAFKGLSNGIPLTG